MSTFRVEIVQEMSDLYEVEANTKEEAIDLVFGGSYDPIDTRYFDAQVEEVVEV